MTPLKRLTEPIDEKTIGIKLSSAALIIFSTVTTVASVMGTYYSLRGDIKDVANRADTQTQINNLRFNNLEKSQSEDHEWLRTVSHRMNDIEEKNGIKPEQKQLPDHK